jgi:hypothetical protein
MEYMNKYIIHINLHEVILYKIINNTIKKSLKYQHYPMVGYNKIN